LRAGRTLRRMGTELKEDQVKRPTRGGLALLGLLAAAVVVLVASLVANRTDDAPADPSSDAKRVCVEEFVPKRLKAPASAEFVGVTVDSVGDAYVVTGSVDAQNGFGATIREPFTCIVREAGSKWVLQSAAVG
jgi:hypothetical protein